MFGMGLLTSLFKTTRPVTPPQKVGFGFDHAVYAYDAQTYGVRDISLDLSCSNGNTAIIGLNGAGKSTLIDLMNGTLTPSSGKVTVEADGKSYDASHGGRAQIQRIVGTVQREADLYRLRHNVSIEQSIDELLRNTGSPTVQRLAIAGDALAKFSLDTNMRTPLDELDGEQLAPVRHRPAHMPPIQVCCSRMSLCADSMRSAHGMSRTVCSPVASRSSSPRIMSISFAMTNSTSRVSL